MATLSTARPIILDSRDFARGLQGFRLRVATELQSTGIFELDALLQGGVPRGSIIEVCGAGSSGRTSLTFSLLAKATEQQEACAYVDVSDALDPMSLASAGVDLRRVLWVRCGTGETNAAPKPAEPLTSACGPNTVQNGGFGFLDQASAKIKRHGIMRHPRDQIRGVEESIPSVLQSVGEVRPCEDTVPHVPTTHANGVEVVARCAGEQAELGVNRTTLRTKGAALRVPQGKQCCAPTQKVQSGVGRSSRARVGRGKPWKKLEQALKATDILLHSGGWGVVVFDLGNISWVDARRMELSTWFRFRRTIENTPTILLLLGEDTCAKSCSSMVLQCERKNEKWNCTDLQRPTEGIATLEGFEVEGRIMCSRMGLQPMDSAQWTTRMLWTDSF
jgi:recombination protein RecA